MKIISKFKIKNNKILILAFFFASFFLSYNAFAMMCGAMGSNEALNVICDIIIFLQGRIGRAIATVSVMMTAWEFSQGSIKWQGIVIAMIGMGMFFAPKTLALFVLPSYIRGIQGGGYDPNQTYTPDQIISCFCPNLV
jgi:type IV secretory pathway VirB2 component (pilin)